MTRRLAVVLTVCLLLVIPSRLTAKGKTVKIVVQGADLTKPIEISDAHILADFQVWTGPGTSSNQPQSLITDWLAGEVNELPKELTQYEVFFYVNEPKERIAYVVGYGFDHSTDRGFVYIPGKSDRHFESNVSTIFRGVEGHWFHAWTVWDRVAVPLITRARASSSIPSV